MTSMGLPTAAGREVETTREWEPLPGDLVVWMLILLEVTTFALMFVAFTWMRSLHPDIFHTGQQHLHPVAGLINTLALLTASALVAQGVVANRADRQRQACRWLWAALAAALIYVVVKCWEYGQLGGAGLSLRDNHFFMAYFLITGFHLLHVILGMGFLWVMAGKLFRGGYGQDNALGLESGASYCHMVDLIWILLFPILYVIR